MFRKQLIAEVKSYFKGTTTKELLPKENAPFTSTREKTKDKLKTENALSKERYLFLYSSHRDVTIIYLCYLHKKGNQPSM